MIVSSGEKAQVLLLSSMDLRDRRVAPAHRFRVSTVIFFIVKMSPNECSALACQVS